MHVVFVAAEIAPWSKVGGLADVISALPAALTDLGVSVTVVTPRHASVPTAALHDTGRSVSVHLGARLESARVLEATGPGGVRVLFLDHPGFYDREGIYGHAEGDWPDNAERFAFLSAAALGARACLDEPVDLWHAHDWHGALVPALLRAGAGGEPAILTIHNGAHQGWFPARVVGRLGLPGDALSPGLDDASEWVSFLEAGVASADHVTAVSPRYAEDLRDPGHTGSLARRLDALAEAGRLTGIVNRIDTSVWDPSTDPWLDTPYDRRRLPLKARNTEALRAELGLEASGVPLVGVVARLVHQKGADLLAAALPALLELPVQVVILGAGSAAYEQALHRVVASSPGRAALRVAFDEGLAHRITAGADLFLLPSRFEPCGLNQQYAMRYGTVPVVTSVGGFVDTVTDVSSPGGTGFLFGEATPEALVAAVGRAAGAFRDRDGFWVLQDRIMAQDLSWTSSARRYESLYRAMLRSHRRAS